MKKFLIASSFLIGIILTSCGGGSNNAEIARLRAENEQLREQIGNQEKVAGKEAVVEKPTQPSGPVGTYEIKDAAGQKWILKINADESATLENNGKTFYGSWDKSYFATKAPHTFFSEPYDINIKFPNSEDLDAQHMTLDLTNGFIYGNDLSGDALKAKNPRKRLEIKKIN